MRGTWPSGPQGIVTFVGTRKTKVWSVTDRNKDRVADEVKDFAPSINFTIPNGPCFSKDGMLYIAEHNRVLVFPAAEFFYESPDVAAFNVVKQGELIPRRTKATTTRRASAASAPDGKLYITLGQPFNVPAEEKLELYNKAGIGGIIRMDTDGTDREVFANGVRNSVGMDFAAERRPLVHRQSGRRHGRRHPARRNQPCDQGRPEFRLPLVSAAAPCAPRNIRTQRPRPTPCRRSSETVAHAADLGMTFYTGKQVPEEISRRHLLGAARLVEPHQSGRRARDVHAGDRGRQGGRDRALRRRLADHDGEYLGRPVDVAQLPDGSLLVSDDLAGAIYRISYEN